MILGTRVDSGEMEEAVRRIYLEYQFYPGIRPTRGCACTGVTN